MLLLKLPGTRSRSDLPLTDPPRCCWPHRRPLPYDHASAHRQIVETLRSRHGNLLRTTPAGSGGRGASTTPSSSGVSRGSPGGGDAVPIRLVTNGLWLVAPPVPFPARTAPSIGEGGAGPDDDPDATCVQKPAAAVLAAEIAELFDHVSIALNTAEPQQYNQVTLANVTPRRTMSPARTDDPSARAEPIIPTKGQRPEDFRRRRHRPV